MNYLMKADGSFYRVLIAPVRRSSIVLGQLLEAVLCSFLEVGIMILVSVLFFIQIPLSYSVVFSVIVFVFLTAFFMAGLCYSISLILPNEVIYETVMNAIVLPVFFLSTALFPAESLHGVLAAVININPFTHMINVLRTMILYGRIEFEKIVPVMLLFVVLGVSSFAWAQVRLKKETNL